jgi:putative transposase
MSQRRIRHEMLAETIASIHRSSRACYGVRRVHAELVHGLGIQVGRDQVALVMSRLGLRGISGTRKRYLNREHLITTEDLVERNFTATTPNQLWCTDITEHPTREGKVYCCCVLDVYSRKIVGWAIDTRQTTHLVLNALDMAIEARKPTDTVIHADHGTQFTSWAFTSRIREAGLVGSMGTIGDGYDNAMIESFWGTMQVELLNRKKWRTRLELANAMFEYIEVYYNRSRRHSALDWDSPTVFETKGQKQKISA